MLKDVTDILKIIDLEDNDQIHSGGCREERQEL